MKKLILTLIFLCIPAIAFAETVNLSWDANKEPDIAGYEVYVGSQSGVYGVPVNVGNVTAYALNLNVGTHYITVKAYDTAGNKSDFSYEIKYIAKLAKVTGLGVK